MFLASACVDAIPENRIIQYGPGHLVLTERLSVGDASGPGAIGRPSVVAADAEGRLWVVSEESSAIASVFDSTGAFAMTVGREGDGPEEFRAIGDVAGVGSSMMAFDIRTSRVSEVSLDGRVLRTLPLRFTVTRAKAGPNGTMALAGRAHGDTLVMPIAVMDPATLGVVSTTGAADEGLPYRIEELNSLRREVDFYVVQRSVSWTSEGHILSVPWLDYRIETWGATGELLDTWAREPEWMPPQTAQIDMTLESQQHPMVFDVHVDEHGRLWTMIRVNAPDWHRGLGAALTTSTGERAVKILDINRVFGTRIEVLDVTARRVLASIYTPDLFVNFLPDGRAVSYVEDLNAPKVIVWDVDLDPRQ